MKIRTTVHWPEKNAIVNDILDLPDDEAKARIDAGFAKEHVEEAPAAETAPAEQK